VAGVPRGAWWADGGRNRNEVPKTDPLAGGCPPELLERQACQYAELFQLFRDGSESIGRVTFWDLHDGRSWLNTFPWKHAEQEIRCQFIILRKSGKSGVSRLGNPRRIVSA